MLSFQRFLLLKELEHPDKTIHNQPKQPRSKPAHLLNPSVKAPAVPSPSPSTDPTSTLPTSSDAPAADPGIQTTATAPRAKPAHLTRSNTGAPIDPSSGRTDARNAAAAAPADASAPSAPAPPAATTTRWEHVPTQSGRAGARSAARKGPADTKSATLSSTGGWGHPAHSPWDSASVASSPAVKKAQGGASAAKGKRWAEQMENEDETRSVAASTTSR